MNKDALNKTLIYTIAYIFIIIGYVYSNGFYFIPSLMFMTLSLAILLYHNSKKTKEAVTNIEPKTFFSLILMTFVSLSAALYGGLYQQNVYGLITFSRTLIMLALMLSFLYVINLSKVLSILNRIKFWLLILIALSIRIFMIISSPSPYIDTFTTQKLGSEALISGHNPYSIIFPKLYPDEIPDFYSYGPALIFLNVPAVTLTGDPRYTMVSAEIITALLIYFALKKTPILNSKIHEILPLIFLFNPRASFLTEQAYVDPLLILLITLVTFSLFIWKKEVLSMIMLGIAISTKHYTILLIPFLINSRAIKMKNLHIPIWVYLLISSTFLLWNFRDFIHDTLSLVGWVVQKNRYDSLSFNSLIHQFTNHNLPQILIILITFISLVYLLKIQKKLVASAFLFTSSAFALSIFTIYPLAFINYYYFAGSLLLLSIVLTILESTKRNG